MLPNKLYSIIDSYFMDNFTTSGDHVLNLPNFVHTNISGEFSGEVEEADREVCHSWLSGARPTVCKIPH